MDTFHQEGETLRRTIVLVEDDLANAEVLTLLLQTGNNYDVLHFREGGEVLAHLNLIQEKRPALFLLDYQLSGMTALNLYERFQTAEGLEKVPVLVVSATTLSEEQKERLHQLGLLLIPKPYDVDELLTTIDHMIT